ncbi:acetyl-CoA carboxylase biotin carboxyl carrier protein [Tsuneonella sp. HG094]|jgi:acetyl-CoA carboxylase biotin carboxyl carrier protein
MDAEGAMPDIEQLIAEFEASDLRELHVRRGEFEIYLSKDSGATGIGSAHATAASGLPAHSASPSAPPSAGTPVPSVTGAEIDETAWPEGAIVVRAPYLGTFYRSPKPGSPAYVDIGSRVAVDDELCLVEVMKLFTAVRADHSGRVEAILVGDGEMVAADQPLFLIMPD